MKIIKRRRWKILRKDDLPEGNICANDGPGVISRTNHDQEAVAASGENSDIILGLSRMDY